MGLVSGQCESDALDDKHALTPASEFAEDHPESQVFGVDLSPIQPSIIPPNCTFMIDDCTQAWSFPKDHFDLVHIRALFGSVADWPAFYKEAYE